MRHIPRWAFMIMANCRRLVQISKQANDGKVPRDYVHKGVPFNLVQSFLSEPFTEAKEQT